MPGRLCVPAYICASDGKFHFDMPLLAVNGALRIQNKTGLCQAVILSPFVKTTAETV